MFVEGSQIGTPVSGLEIIQDKDTLHTGDFGDITLKLKKNDPVFGKYIKSGELSKKTDFFIVVPEELAKYKNNISLDLTQNNYWSQ